MADRSRGSGLWLAVVALLVVVLAACGSTTPAASTATTAATQPSGAGSAAASQATQASQGTSAKTTLVFGTDISDINSLDPEKQFSLNGPIPHRGMYETLVTVEPPDYTVLKPLLAQKWEKTPDGKAWVFHLRTDVKFASGNPMTADDVKFSFDRLKNLKVDASALADNIASVDVVDPATVKISMVDKNQPLLAWLISPDFGVADSKTVAAEGGVSGPGADTKDQASAWLDTHSAGTGPYQLESWTRNSDVSLSRNPNYWRTPAPFEKVIIRHVPDGATQLLQIQRGDIDVALNLSFDQIQGLGGNNDIRVVKGQSLDYLYLALTVNPAKSAALAKKEARQALLYAIDYDGIINGLYGGDAVRPLSFIPIGLGGSTLELGQQFGYHQDLDKAKQLVQAAGLPNGFEFKLSYGTGAAVSGVSYEVVAQKIKSDLARVGITANLDPQEQGNLRTAFRAGDLTSVLTFWNPDALDPALWADPTVQRVAKRLNWEPPKDIVDLVAKADGEQDQTKRDQLYVDFQKKLADEANLQVLLQPIYSVAVRNTIATYQLTAAGYQVDLYTITPR